MRQTKASTPGTAYPGFLEDHVAKSSFRHLGLNEAPVLKGVYGTGLSLKHKLLPAFMRDLGYETHLIGRVCLLLRVLDLMSDRNRK